MTLPVPAGLEARVPSACSRFGLPESGPFQLLAGDVGQRRYLRLRTWADATVVLVLYPEPSSPAQERWRRIGEALAREGLRVPALLDDDPASGTALVEDLGDRDLAADLREAAPDERARLLEEAEELLAPLRGMAPEAALLAHTRRWALEGDGARPLAPERAAEWEELAARLAREAADASRVGGPVPTHRDFHANNLMRTPEGALALIDFQDLRLGHPDYDPVSLRFERAGALVSSSGGDRSEAVLLQRAWKVLGTFEKMLALGREVYRPHRDAALRTIRERTRPNGPFAPLLAFLPG
ncbi:MAG TPA: phosphotransferase [Thermoanaerobaculia bacterium]|nr:phosphotransferase [Thermoanaerobaculia bacterium]